MAAKIVTGDRWRFVLVTPDELRPDVRYPLVILLHGYGADMYDLAPLASGTRHYVFAFPNAPFPAATGGFSWTEGSRRTSSEAPDMRAVEADLLDLTDAIVAATGTDPDRVVIGGFSQGGGLALRLGLVAADRFAGVVVMSSALRLGGLFEDSPLPEPMGSRPQRVFLSHGRYDELINIESGRKARSFLDGIGCSTTYREYDCGHDVPEEVAYDLAIWLLELFAVQTQT